jgi:hypothetical protein
MKTTHIVALLVAFVPLTGVADEPVAGADSAEVAMLKADLPSTLGFKLDTLKKTDAGVACIKYRVSNSKGGESPGLAVVEGDKVLRMQNGNAAFEKAWNSKCAKSGKGS